MSEDKLRTHTAMLKQQARELETEVLSLRLHPRYSALLVDQPWGMPIVVDGPAEVQRLDLEIEQIRSALGRLSSTEALDEVRGAIREYREAEKRHARRRQGPTPRLSAAARAVRSAIRPLSRESDQIESEAIVADTIDGKPLAAGQGPFKIVSLSDARPARSVRRLQRLDAVRLEQ